MYDHELTGREKEIVFLILEEFTTREIAFRLDISIRTVDSHRLNISRKTGTRTLVGLTLYAIRNGWVDGYAYNGHRGF